MVGASNMCLQGSNNHSAIQRSVSEAEETQSRVLLAVTSDAETLLKHLGTDEYSGLSTEQAESCLQKYGYNELAKEEATPLWKLVLEQFEDTLVKILLVAALVSFLLAVFDREDEAHHSLHQYVEPIVILVILILNAIVGVWQESNAEAALDALKRLQPDEARALRNGEMLTIPARFLVPGDIVELRVGDKVPADMRLLSIVSSTLRVDQAQLTGESESVEKHTDPLPPSDQAASYVIQSKTNMLFATTTVVNGMGRAVVVATGMDTEIGQIQQAVEKAAEEDDSTPLQKKLDEFGDMLSHVIMVICVIVWLINYKNFFDPIHGSVLQGCIYYFKIAVALAVAAIPEGLPTVITTCLALGRYKIAG
jgi:Ca2+-transporting ATPase